MNLEAIWNDYSNAIIYWYGIGFVISLVFDFLFPRVKSMSELTTQEKRLKILYIAYDSVVAVVSAFAGPFAVLVGWYYHKFAIRKFEPIIVMEDGDG